MASQSPSSTVEASELRQWYTSESFYFDSMPLPKERLDRIVNVVLAVHPARQHLLVVAQMLVEHVDEVAGAVGAGDLAVAEHVAHGQELLLEEHDAVAAVGFGAGVAVAEVEQVDVPLVGAVVGVEQL